MALELVCVRAAEQGRVLGQPLAERDASARGVVGYQQPGRQAFDLIGSEDDVANLESERTGGGCHRDRRYVRDRRPGASGATDRLDQLLKGHRLGSSRVQDHAPVGGGVQADLHTASRGIALSATARPRFARWVRRPIAGSACLAFTS